jgi:hypothetical protein
MLPGTVRAICVIFLCLGFSAAKAQYKQLNINDFQGRPEPANGHVAYTNCTIDFTYQPVPSSNNYYRINFNVNVVMNKDRSWIDRSKITSEANLAEILKHEQGHYALAYLMQQELLRVLNNNRYGYNYEQQVKRIFNSVTNKYKQLNLDYDEDTHNSTDRQQQHSWDLFFRQQLGQYDTYAMARQSR